jgi:hypothetical protein
MEVEGEVEGEAAAAPSAAVEKRRRRSRYMVARRSGGSVRAARVRGFRGKGKKGSRRELGRNGQKPKAPRATAKAAPSRQRPRHSPWPLSSPQRAACSALAAAEDSSPWPPLAPLPPRLAATARRSDRRRRGRGACSPRCGRWATRAHSLCRRSNCGRRGPEIASEPLSSNASSGSSASAAATARPSR